MSSSYTTIARSSLGPTLTIDQLYHWHRVHSPNVAAFVFPGDKNEQISLTWKALGEGIDRGVQIIQNYVPETRIATCSRHSEPVVVGILSSADTITCTTFLYSHFHLTHPSDSGCSLLPFLISTRNSAAAVAHLVKVTGTKYVWVTDGPMRALANEALLQGGLKNIVVLSFPSFSELYSDLPCLSDTYPPNLCYEVVSLDTPAVIIHSSGSTAFPKPCTLTHRILKEMGRNIELDGFIMKGETLAVHGLPTFHALGVLCSIWAAVSEFIRAASSPQMFSPPMDPENFLRNIFESRSTTVICVPSFLETWATEPNSLMVIKKLKAVLWGGAPLRQDVGLFLLEQGVNLQILYGATEFGRITSVPAKPRPEGYEWFKFASHIRPELVPDESEGGVYELMFKESDVHHMSMYNTVIDGVRAYATNDLVQRHESDPDLFKIVGRKDDQIMLSTGEKTNPGPLEAIIGRNPHVKNALIFGRGRHVNGVLVEPMSYEEVENLGLEKFRNLIWSSIEEANEYAPAHSRIYKEMIHVSSASKPFSYTVKLNLKRDCILRDYAQEIEAAYNAVTDFSNSDFPIPSGSSVEGGWTESESLEIVRKAVRVVTTDAKIMGDDDDVFEFGCDSLQVTYIRNTILHALRQVTSPTNVHKVPSNFVYHNPTIRRLAAFVAQASRSVGVVEVERGKTRNLLALVNKYTKDWPIHCPSTDAIDATNEVILLTGSTGALGSQLLAQLVLLPTVTHIYALNKPGKTAILQRHIEAFLERGNNLTLLDSEKIIYVEGDTAAEGFDIEPELFKKIRDSVTTIIHNAWRVDFNISLVSFEPLIRGVRRLVDFALQSPHPSPPRVMFTSTIGIIKTWSNVRLVAESPVTDPSLIAPTGYSGSKWVSEQVLSIAGQSTALQPIIIRVGQLCGGLNGSWNVKEWFPSLVRVSQVVRGAPITDGLVNFIPLHAAASALIELRHTSNQFVHIVHPRPVSWSIIIQHVAEALNVPIIPYAEWLCRLEALKTGDASQDQHDPALHLLDHYRSLATPSDVRVAEGVGAMGHPMYDTKFTVAGTQSLSASRLPQLEKKDVQQWIDYWRRKGALQP